MYDCICTYAPEYNYNLCDSHSEQEWKVAKEIVEDWIHERKEAEIVREIEAESTAEVAGLQHECVITICYSWSIVHCPSPCLVRCSVTQ